MDIEAIGLKFMRNIEVDDNERALKDPDLMKELKSLSCKGTEVETLSPSLEKDTQFQMPGMKEVSVSPEDYFQRTSPVNTVALEERLKLYNDASEAATKLNERSEFRNYDKAVENLEQPLKSLKSGKVINEEEIPPLVSILKDSPSQKPKMESEVHVSLSVSAANDAPAVNLMDIFSELSSAETQKTNVSQDISNLMARKNEYKVAALKAKKAGDKTSALSLMKSLKTVDAIIESAKNGEVDSLNIPFFPSPQSTIMPVPDYPRKQSNEIQASLPSSTDSAAPELENSALINGPPSVVEVLHQRLNKFKTIKESAQTEGNNSKVRRLERIIKSYEKAVTDFQAGKPVDFEELPTLPDFAPIPIPDESAKPKQLCALSAASGEEQSAVPDVSLKKPAAEVPLEETAPQVTQRTNTSTADKQLEFLLEQQRMFRQAAILSKKNGDLVQAKNYLRLSKGFNSMIEAACCGLPINMSSIPTPPQFQSDFIVVGIKDGVKEHKTFAEIFETLESDLIKQLEVCRKNKDHFLKLGDASSASKFEKLGLESKKDLSIIYHLRKTGQKPPPFYYETRLFSIVPYNIHLSDSELEVVVERGINLPGKSGGLDSYIKIELPVLSDALPKAKTHTVYGTNNPVYQAEFKFEINRQSRVQLRQFKRGVLKLECWSKGRFLVGDTLIGKANVKLVDLESKCSIEDTFDLMNGRKNSGGKLEVKVRIRSPLLAAQGVEEKWLVIGS